MIIAVEIWMTGIGICALVFLAVYEMREHKKFIRENKSSINETLEQIRLWNKL